MSENTARPSNEESGIKNNRKPAEIKYVNKSLVDKYFEKYKIKVDSVLFESSQEKIQDGSNNSGASSANPPAGSHTKIEQSVEYKLAYLFKFGVLQFAAKDQVPKVKKAKITTNRRKEEQGQETEKGRDEE